MEKEKKNNDSNTQYIFVCIYKFCNKLYYLLSMEKINGIFTLL